MIIRSVPRYLARDHHPSQEPGSRELAIAYLAHSPAVQRQSRQDISSSLENQ